VWSCRARSRYATLVCRHPRRVLEREDHRSRGPCEPSGRGAVMWVRHRSTSRNRRSPRRRAPPRAFAPPELLEHEHRGGPRPITKAIAVPVSNGAWTRSPDRPLQRGTSARMIENAPKQSGRERRLRGRRRTSRRRSPFAKWRRKGRRPIADRAGRAAHAVSCCFGPCTPSSEWRCCRLAAAPQRTLERERGDPRTSVP